MSKKNFIPYLLRFDTEWISRGCSNRFLVTHKQVEKYFRKLHNTIIVSYSYLQTPADMEVKWKRLVRSNTICDAEETKVNKLYFHAMRVGSDVGVDVEQS